jgi:SAM-dependent methyltransferase
MTIWTDEGGTDEAAERAFFEQMRGCRDAYRRLGDAIFSLALPVRTALDIGCGVGDATERLSELGWDIAAAEYSAIARSMMGERIRLRATELDLSLPLRGSVVTYDAVICTETAEHLPVGCADYIVDHVAKRSAKWVIWSAAQPVQNWAGHINLQCPSYWLDKFAGHGFRLCLRLSAHLRDEMKRRHAQHEYCASNFHVLQRRIP